MHLWENGRVECVGWERERQKGRERELESWERHLVENNRTSIRLSLSGIDICIVIWFQLLFILNLLVWQIGLCVLWQQLFSRDFWYFLLLVRLEIPQKQLSLWYFGTWITRTRWHTEVQRKPWIWIMIHFKKSSFSNFIAFQMMFMPIYTLIQTCASVPIGGNWQKGVQWL